MPKQTQPRPTRLLVAVLAATTLLVGACSAGGSDDAGDKTTTTARADKTTTTAADEETTTTEGTDPGGDDPTTSDLEAILPTADDLGAGWTASTESDDGQEDTTIEDQCPEAAALIPTDDEDDSDHAKAHFQTSDGREVSVELTPEAKQLGKDDLEQYATALNDCKPEITDPDTGLKTAFAFDVTPTDAYGDAALQIEATVTLSGDALPKTIELMLYSLVYRTGSVGVEISGQDGVDDATAAVKAFDPDLLIKLADDVDPKITDLVGG
ncbi:hypothetical protein KSP35_08505 [Aquihabitans sp. G128]|uniref:hypothetical protein n=1 Tax=Aquihabitans sp. G128 TaxID=2849779 RepID=UPI001C2200B7|nr:hypothetical protein [Aquihabitans sp. G128]QXC62804.1 hypothetical protein KSP35_08505 [Aquihabitans sp. G128]